MTSHTIHTDKHYFLKLRFYLERLEWIKSIFFFKVMFLIKDDTKTQKLRLHDLSSFMMSPKTLKKCWWIWWILQLFPHYSIPFLAKKSYLITNFALINFRKLLSFFWNPKKWNISVAYKRNSNLSNCQITPKRREQSLRSSDKTALAKKGKC